MEQTIGNSQQAAGSFGDRLKQLRGSSGKTLEQMAVEIGISATVLFGYEENLLDLFPSSTDTIVTFKQYCDRVGISSDWFFFGIQTEAA